MKKIFVFAIAMVMVLGLAGMAFAGVSGSAHDLASGAGMDDVAYGVGTFVDTVQICVFCHHPHRGDAGAGATVKNTLLWNMDDFSRTSYATYAQSGTMNAGDVGVAVDSADAYASQSFLCMACHDGTIGVGALVTTPGDNDANVTVSYALDPRADLGTTLADDHPVNIIYPTDDTLIVTNNGNMVNSTYPLFGGGKMQCGTCHDVHAGGTDSASSASNMDFMRGDIRGSQICLDCHLGK